jgi:PAS domain S-box-containing protein
MASSTNQAHLDAIINSAMDAIISVNDEQKIEIFNPAAEAMFGWTAVDIIGHPLDLLIPERFRQVHPQHIRGFGQNGVTNRRMVNLDVLYGLRADGTEFPIEAAISYTETSGKNFTPPLCATRCRVCNNNQCMKYIAQSRTRIAPRRQGRKPP